MNARRYSVEASIDIAASPAAVWADLGDFHGVANWARGVVAHPIGDRPNGLGAGRRCDIAGLGRVDEIVVEWQPPTRLAYSVTPVGPFGPGIAHWNVTPLGVDGARVTQRFVYAMRFGLLGALLHGLLVGRKLAQAQPGVLRQLRNKVES
jgi:uncharacterized protein YndB with AHSA1/START domain